MTQEQTFICFDTNMYVYCALASVDEKLNSEFLRRILNDMDRAGVLLIMPEVVSLELGKVLDKNTHDMVDALTEMRKVIEENVTLGLKTKKQLKRAIAESKRSLSDEAGALLKDIEDRAQDPSRCVFVPLSEGDIVTDAIRIAIRGAHPAKNGKNDGLLQSDCLIASSIKHFMNQHPSCRVVLCSNNTRDFACKDNGGEYVLREDLAEYLVGLEYCDEPLKLYKTVLNGLADSQEIEPLNEEYKRVSSRSLFEEALHNVLEANAALYADLAKMGLAQTQLIQDLTDIVSPCPPIDATRVSLQALALDPSLQRALSSMRSDVLSPDAIAASRAAQNASYALYLLSQSPHSSDTRDEDVPGQSGDSETPANDDAVCDVVP